MYSIVLDKEFIPRTVLPSNSAASIIDKMRDIIVTRRDLHTNVADKQKSRHWQRDFFWLEVNPTDR